MPGSVLAVGARWPRRRFRPAIPRAHISEQILAVRSAIAGERKQVSVLFCDIVSSSALAAELGPEEFHLVIDRFFRIALAEVHRYEGTVNQFLGDGFMALFGAPSTPAECSLPRSNYSRNQPGPWPKTPYTHGTQTSRPKPKNCSTALCAQRATWRTCKTRPGPTGSSFRQRAPRTIARQNNPFSSPGGP
jgi:class 3 adenylate cyclase